MTTPMNAHAAPFRALTTIFASAIAILTACAPCDAVIVTAGPIDLCPDDGHAASTGGESSNGNSEGSSGGDSDPTTGDLCTFDPGTAWGPCVDGGCPNSTVTAFCINLSLGAVCMPACGGDGCPVELAECGPGVCLDDGACAHPCDANAAPSGCPDGMACDPTLGGVCVW